MRINIRLLHKYYLLEKYGSTIALYCFYSDDIHFFHIIVQISS